MLVPSLASRPEVAKNLLGLHGITTFVGDLASWRAVNGRRTILVDHKEKQEMMDTRGKQV